MKRTAMSSREPERVEGRSRSRRWGVEAGNPPVMLELRYCQVKKTVVAV